MSKKIWLVTAGEPHFYSSLNGALQELNYLHHSMADTFPRDMTDKETGFKEFLWELTDIDTKEDFESDPWATDIWSSVGWWWNSYTQEKRTTIISLLAVPIDVVHGEAKFDHAETDLLVDESHL